MTQNYALFGKNLNKIAIDTADRFGGTIGVEMFLQAVCNCGNVALAAKSATDISPIELHKIIKDDRYLNRCVKLALAYAASAAEGILYDRAINGYEELSYNKNGECISRKKKYCSRSLLEYLKANFLKYRTPKYQDKHQSKYQDRGKKAGAVTGKPEDVSYEVESYEQKKP